MILKTTTDWGPSKDAQRYEVVSRNLVDGNGLGLAGMPEVIFSPGYPIILAPFIAAGLSPAGATSALTWISFAAFVGIVYYGVAKRYDKRTGAISAFAIATCGALQIASLDAAAEVIMLPFLAGGIVAMHSKAWRHQLFAGMLFAVGYLVKPEMLAYVGLAIAFMFLVEKTGRSWRILLRLLLPTLFALVGYAGFIYAETGTIAISGKSALIRTAQWVENPQYHYDAETYRLNSDMTIGIKPGEANLGSIYWPKRIWYNLIALDHLLPVVLFPVGIVFAALVISLIKLRSLRREAMFFAALTAPLGIGVFLFYQQRYLLPLVLAVTLLLGFAAAGFLREKTKRLKYLAALPISALILLNFAPWLKGGVDEHLITAVASRSFVDEVTPLLSEYRTIVSRTPTYSYLLGKDYSPIPYSYNVGNSLRYLRGLDRPVIVLDEWATKPNPTTDYFRKKYHLANTAKVIIDPVTNRITRIGRVRQETVPTPTYPKHIRRAQGIR